MQTLNLIDGIKDLFDWELNWFVQGLRILMAWLCEIIYFIIRGAYDLFINLTKVDILGNETIKPIYQRITLILTIVMVFYVTFQFVKYIVQPEMMTDKEQGAGKIVYRMIAVVLLIAFVPNVFTAAIKLQNAVVQKGVIGKIVLGQNSEVNDNFGGIFATQMLSMFYSVPNEYANEDCEGIPCLALVEMNKTALREGGTLYLTTGINAGKDVAAPSYGGSETVKTPFIQFDGLFAVIAGGFILYILVLYCVDVGTRWAQLVYLQVIAPIPIIGFLSPKKDGIFQKWCKQCFTTYIDLFLRISIIYIVLLLCSVILSDRGDLFANIGEVTPFMESMIVIFLVLGLMQFATKAPKMLSELFPASGAASGNFSLKPGGRGVDRLFGAAAGTVIGAGAGLATGLGQGLRRARSVDPDAKWYKKAGAAVFGAGQGIIGGTVGGAARGLANGAKKGNVIKNATAGAKNQIKANERFGNRQENGYGFADQMGDRLRGAVGAPSREKVHEDRKAELTRQKEAYSSIAKSTDSERDYAWKKAQSGKSKFYANYVAAQGKENYYRDKTIAELQAAGVITGGTPEAQERQRQALIQTAIDDQKQWKDIATNDYLNNSGDGALVNMRKELAAQIADYNKYVSDSYKIPETVSFTYDKLNDDGTKTRVQVNDKKISELDAQELDEYKKKVDNEISRLGIKINEETAAIEHIKRQTAGSGINEGKK